MKINKIKNYYKSIYIFFIFFSLIIFFFSTSNANSKAYKIENIEVSKPFEMKFDKNKVIDEGFKKAFEELILLIVNSSDQIKISNIKLSEIKAMIESFTIKEEKFINEIYYLNLGVSFNKKQILKFLEIKNIFPSIPNKKKILFIPIIIEEKKKDLFIFNNNKLYDEWLNYNESYHLIEYILPTEDLEDLNIIKEKYDQIEEYDFKEITNKYSLEDSIVSILFKKDNDVRVISRITIKDKVFLKNKLFENINLNDINQAVKIIQNLRNDYEDYWKNLNLINTSLKLPLTIKIKNSNKQKIFNFESIINEQDLIYEFSIIKYNKDFIIYNVIFNGTPNVFLKKMQENGFNINTQNKIWTLE
jgi:hypothetical protein